MGAERKTSRRTAGGKLAREHSRASAVVVGAGVLGASVAWHLARRGWRDVLVLDAARKPGRGSTGSATGGFRAQFATEVEVRLSLLAREALRRFEAETGVDPEFEPAGYLWLAQDGAQLEALRRALRVQHDAGLAEAREVTPDEAGRLNAAADLEGVSGGAFCPSDGFVRPHALLRGYLEAAEWLGVRVRWGRRVTGLKRAADRVAAVQVGRERIACDVVVNAAGPWAGEIARLAGADLPVQPLRRQVGVTRRFRGLPRDMPMTIWLSDGFHLRVRDDRVLLLRPTPGVPDRPWDCTLEPEWLAATYDVACRRVPALRETAVDPSASWAGLYEMTPDRHAVLGPAPECPNLFHVAGASGHGVMHAPALGMLAAEALSDGAATSLDISALRPTRFVEGAPNVGIDVL